MTVKTFEVLLIEDDVHDVEMVRRAFKAIYPPLFDLQHASRLLDGVKLLTERSFEVILLDLGLPDSDGLRGLERLMSMVPETPVIILTGVHDEGLALRAIELGAQEFLDKGEVSSESIIRCIRFAAKRMLRFQASVTGRMSSSVNGKLMELVHSTSKSILSNTQALEATSLSTKQSSLVTKIRDQSQRSTEIAKQIAGSSGPTFEPVVEAERVD